MSTNAAVLMPQSLGNGIAAKHMLKPEKILGGQEDATSTVNAPSQSTVLSMSSIWQKHLKRAYSISCQKLMQNVTNSHTRKPDRTSSSTKLLNWSYRLLRRKQLLVFVLFLILILYLTCSISDSDYDIERVPVLHYSHVPGMKVFSKLIKSKQTPTAAPEPPPLQSSVTSTHTKEFLNDSYIEDFLTYDPNNTDIIRPPTGYLVWSDSCRIPELDVHAPDIMRYFKREKYKPCSNKKPLTTVVFNTSSLQYVLQVEDNLLKTYSKSGRIHCCYQPITRNGTAEISDDDYRLGKCVPFNRTISLPNEIDNILVQCDSNKRNVYKNGHPLLNEKPEVTERLSSWKQEDFKLKRTKPPSILMIGIDSISRINLIRSMPKTAQHLYDNDWFELTGYNKIDDNTFPNMMALLAGYNQSITTAKCPPRVMGALDNCSLIWNTFREYGYVTGYGEDASEISTFNYYKVGFTKPPVDYYLRPFELAAEHNLSKTLKSGLTFCLGQQQSAQFVFDYAIEFATRFKDDPLLGLFWVNSFSHNSLSDPSSMDTVVVSYLERLSTLGLLEHMTVVFFSDHGLRFGPARLTASGHMEERLPFIFIWLPPYLKHKYSTFVNALSMNKNRLSTPYDLHMTLKHFLILSERVEEKDKFKVLAKAEACPKCQTLLEPIPLNRSCRDAAIEEHWCTCIPYTEVDRKVVVVQMLANRTVNYINKLVLEFKNGTMKTLCRNLWLANVTSAHRSHEAFRPKAPDGTILDVYRLQLVTKPNKAQFEVTLRHNSKTDVVEFTGEISRLDSYLKDSHCILDSFVKKYCSCA